MKGDPVAHLEAWGDWRMEAFVDTSGVLFGECLIVHKRLSLFYISRLLSCVP